MYPAGTAPGIRAVKTGISKKEGDFMKKALYLLLSIYSLLLLGLSWRVSGSVWHGAALTAIMWVALAVLAVGSGEE